LVATLQLTLNASILSFRNPRHGEIYNIGGSRSANVSVLEAIQICEKLTGEQFKYEYIDINRIGDHIWWISDVSKFQSYYPVWHFKYDIEARVEHIYEAQIHDKKCEE